MNQDVLQGRWTQMKGELKSWWGKLTDEDLDRIGGSKDKLVGMIQEKYGYMKDEAQREVNRRLQEYGDRVGSSQTGSMGTMSKSKAEDVASSVSETVGSIKAKAEEVASTVVSRENLEKMATAGVELIRRYPMQSLLIGLGIGYLLARRPGRHDG